MVLGWDSNDQHYDNVKVTGWHTGYPDAEGRMVPDTMRIIPFEDDLPLFLCKFAGKWEDVCPRGMLRRVLSRVADMGYSVSAAIRSLDIYSGHADADELQDWVEKRKPIGRTLFLVHGEAPAMERLAARLTKSLPAAMIRMPMLDDAYELTAQTAEAVDTGHKARLLPEQIARHDWHNDLSKLILDLNDAIRQEADEKGRARLIRKIRRALEDGNGKDAGGSA